MESLVINNDEFFASVLECLSKGSDATIPVKGFSMLPFIRAEKDLVVLGTVDELREKDIVLFRYCGRYVMHRIISIDGDKVEIMGDGVPENRERVTRSDICAKAKAILRGGKRRRDPYSRLSLWLFDRWYSLLPVRSYLLWIYRRLPWNYFWLRRQSRAAVREQNAETL
ncbi:MAG: S24/S26 family peptidase [Bacteroidales bacterium]|nr:S24/S26 family peptidase [Bacteroidales bacterium]